jgi:radical SAM superfamily enzyme YgiQ (UPF0313 family)
MVKILFTNCPAPLHGSSPYFCLEKKPPQGIGYIAAYLRQQMPDVEIWFVDNYVAKQPMQKVLDAFKPDFFGVYVNSICYSEFRTMMGEIETDAKIMLGGPHTSAMPETVKDISDYQVVGEGEKATLAILKGEVGDGVIRMPLIEDLNELPMPAWDLFENIPYGDTAEFIDRKPIWAMNTSRGCPFGCTFCSNNIIFGKRYRCLSAENVLAQVRYLKEKYGIRGVYFREDNFTVDKQRVIDIAKGLKELDLPWVSESRIDSLDESFVKFLSENLCRGLYIGLESGSQRMLDLMNKGITLEMIRERIPMIHKYGINVMASWIYGLPGETEEERQMTWKLDQELGCRINNRNVFAGIPTSQLYHQMLKSGDYDRIDENFIIRPKGYNQLAQTFYGFVPR